jgi:RNA-directed DNA polymerase
MQFEVIIPTVKDRLVQQAMLQVMQRSFDASFSEHSYGFRPGRSAKTSGGAGARNNCVGSQLRRGP